MLFEGGLSGVVLRKALLVGLALTWGAEGSSLTLFGDDIYRQAFVTDGDDVYLHPYIDSQASPEAASQLKLFEGGAVSFEGSVRAAVSAVSRDFDSYSLVKMNGTRRSGFGLTDGAERIDFKFSIGGVPICGYDLVAHRTATGESIVMGVKPKVTDTFVPPAQDWANTEDTKGTLIAQLRSDYQLPPTEPELVSQDRCLLVQDGRLIPIWNMLVKVDGLHYRGWVDAYTAFKTEPQYFSATGAALVYVENKRTGALKEVALTGLVDGTNELLNDTIESYPLGQTKASEANRTYSYATSDVKFAQASAFTHASRHMDFFKSLGYAFPGTDKVRVVTNAEPGGTPNNALYQPKTSSDYKVPTIIIGNGDGAVLQNLSIDGDVVSHELGHHIVFQYLTSISGPSLTIHEALADFFTFSRTSDACLGESICPADAPDYLSRGACWTAATCLRSGETDLKLTDKVIPGTSKSIGDGHIRGQVISGMLWDLRKNKKMTADEVTALTFKAISFLRESSGFRDLVLALFSADLALNKRKYSQVIYDAAVARGFGGLLTDVNVTNGSYPEIGSADGLTSVPGDDSETSKKFGICGVAVSPSQNEPLPSASRMLLLAMLAAPLLFCTRAMAKPVRARVRRPK